MPGASLSERPDPRLIVARLIAEANRLLRARRAEINAQRRAIREQRQQERRAVRGHDQEGHALCSPRLGQW